MSENISNQSQKVKHDKSQVDALVRAIKMLNGHGLTLHDEKQVRQTIEIMFSIHDNLKGMKQ